MRRFLWGMMALLLGCPSTAVPVLSEPSSITIKPLVFDDKGVAVADFEASEAILASVNLGNPPERFAYAFRDAAQASTTATTQSLTGHSCASLATLDHLQGPLLPRRYRTQALTPSVGDTLALWTTFLYPEQTEIQAKCAYVGQHCYILVDTRAESSALAASAAKLGEAFDNQIYPTDTQVFGADPPGRASDNFNGGQDRVFIVLSPDVGGADQTTLGVVTAVDLLAVEGSNYAKVLYLNSAIDLENALPTMAHEFTHILFNANRLVAHSRATGNYLPLGQDAGYINSSAHQEEKWLNEGSAMLALLVNGYTPEAGTSLILEHLVGFLERPEDFDLTSFNQISLQNPTGGPMDNYGGSALFMAYAHGLDPDFVKRVQTTTATGTAAVTAAMSSNGRDFNQTLQDFSLALVLDGLSSKIPARYQIPYVNLQQDYGFPYAFRGPNASTVPVGVLAPRRYGVRYTRVLFPNGKGHLQVGTSSPGTYRGNLILLRSAEEDTFTDLR